MRKTLVGFVSIVAINNNGPHENRPLAGGHRKVRITMDGTKPYANQLAVG